VGATRKLSNKPILGSQLTKDPTPCHYTGYHYQMALNLTTHNPTCFKRQKGCPALDLCEKITQAEFYSSFTLG